MNDRRPGTERTTPKFYKNRRAGRNNYLAGRKKRSFPRRVSFFIAASRTEAAERSFFRLFQTNTTGPKEAVYLAPRPSLCAASLAFRSLVIPVYSAPLAHRTIYTVQEELCFSGGAFLVFTQQFRKRQANNRSGDRWVY